MASRIVRRVLLIAGLLAVAVILPVAAVLVASKTTGNSDQADRNSSLIRQIQAGRREGQKATCAALSAVIDAGRATITAGIPRRGTPLSPFERSLRRLGYPPRATRRRQAAIAARRYGQLIAAAVEAETGRKGLVRSDGKLNCGALARDASLRRSPVG